MSRRAVIPLALLAVVIVAIAVFASQRGLFSAKPSAAIGGAFQLVDQSGRKVDQGLLKGKWSAVFFGFTYCPDVCPTTLFALGEAERRLGDQARDVQTVFVSVDPERDTPKALGEYLANDAFPKQALGLTGTPEQIAAAAKAYKVYYAKRPLEGGGYTMDHTAITYLMNPSGGFVCPIAHAATPDEIAGKIKAAMAKGRRADSC
ncbi:SCO family protein [Phenylobacterium immobile]|uniref:SCO family protein n=1 Tax=Phenylobacterium immobile TaxID=21 RepID=UPI000B1FB910|nr:SCO family protein [Phenylobacterium immobile]